MSKTINIVIILHFVLVLCLLSVFVKQHLCVVRQGSVCAAYYFPLSAKCCKQSVTPCALRMCFICVCLLGIVCS